MRLGLGLRNNNGPTAFVDQLWIREKANTMGVTPSGLTGPYREQIAQTIRDGAGVPSTITPGYTGTPGLADAGDLDVATGDNTYNSVDDFNAVGSGTEGDPYVVSNVDGQRAQFFNDFTGVYIKFYNCRFKDGTNFEVNVDAGFRGNLIFDQCEFSDTVGSGSQQFFIKAPISMEFTNCLFKGSLAAIRIFGIYFANMSASSTVDISLTDCLINDSAGTWPTNCDFIDNSTNNSGQLNFTCLRCTTAVTTGQGQFFIEARGGDTITADIQQCVFAGFTKIVGYENATDVDFDGFVFKYNTVTDPNEDAIDIIGCSNAEVSYSEFTHNASIGAQQRLVYFGAHASDISGTHPTNIDVHHCKFTKKSGTTDTASNECLESESGENVTFRYNWVSECTEDAFEHIYPYDGCTVEYCVADSCEGQIVDIYKMTDTGFTQITSANTLSAARVTKTYIHHIYGDCNDMGVAIDAVRGVIGHDIEIDNTGGASGDAVVEVRTRDTVDPREVYIAGPLSTDAQAQATAGQTSVDATGTDIEIRYIAEDGTLTTVTD